MLLMISEYHMMCDREISKMKVMSEYVNVGIDSFSYEWETDCTS